MSSMRKYPLIKLNSVPNQNENNKTGLYEDRPGQQEYKGELNECQKQLNVYDNDMYNEMELPLEKFYANPYVYLDYIIGLYFKKLENKNEALGLEDEIMQLYNRKWDEIEKSISAYSEQIKKKLQRDNEIKNEKMGRMKQLSFSDDDDNDDNVDKGNDKEDNNNNIQSDDKGNVGNGNTKLHEYRNNFYLRNPEPKDMVCSEGESCLNKEHIIKQAIECLKGNQICIPSKKYLSVNDLNEDYKHKIEMLDSKHIDDLKYEATAFKNQIPNDDDIKSYNQYTINCNIHKDKYFYLKRPNKDVNKQQMNIVNDIIDLKHINKEKLEKEFHEEAIKTAITKINIHHSELPIQNYDEEEYKNEQLGLHYNDYDNDMKDDYNILRNKLKLFLKEDNLHNLDMTKRKNNNNKNSSNSTSKVVKKKKVLARKESAKNKKPKPVVHKEWVDNWNSKIKDEKLKHERMVENVKKRKEEERKRKEQQKESKTYYTNISNTNTNTNKSHMNIHTKKNDIVDINAIIDEHDEFAQFDNAPTFYNNNINNINSNNNSLNVNKFKHQHI